MLVANGSLKQGPSSHAVKGVRHVRKRANAGSFLCRTGDSGAMAATAGPAGDAVLKTYSATEFWRLPRPKSHVRHMSDPSGRTQSCQTAVANVASAQIRHAAGGTPCTAHGAFASGSAGAALPVAAARTSPSAPRHLLLHELSHPRGFCRYGDGGVPGWAVGAPEAD